MLLLLLIQKWKFLFHFQVPVKVRKRPGKSERTQLKDEGVMFDTEDDTNHESSTKMPGMLL